jgi:hypothetical protein
MAGAESNCRALLQQNQTLPGLSHDKLARNFLAAVQLIATIILLN